MRLYLTPKSLIQLHSHNQRGLCVVTDELKSWYGSFGRYSKGSEQETWLSIWSNAPISVDLKGGRSFNIPKPFVNVVGTTQPDVLKSLLSDGREGSGFIDRILFAYVTNAVKQGFNEGDPDESLYSNWNDVVNSI